MSASAVVALGSHEPKTGKRFSVTENIPVGSIIAVLVERGTVTVSVEVPDSPLSTTPTV